MTITNINELFQNYGITGVPAIDAIILAHIIPLLVTYVTLVFTFLKNCLAKLITDNMETLYTGIKNKMLGSIDMRLCVSQDKSIYPIIKSILFSPTTSSDNLDPKTLGMLALITEGKRNDNKYYDRYNDIYDLYLDTSNNITIEKHMDMGSSISKKYFRFHNYYIVVSENRKTDFSHYYHEQVMGDSNAKTQEKSKDNTKEFFIMFEAIRTNNKIPKDESIITKFLYERFKLKVRIPYKYVMKLNNDGLIAKIDNRNEYLNDDDCAAELDISDGIDKFFSNPKVKEFLHGCKNNNKNIEKKNGISSSLLVEHKGNTLDLESLGKDLSLMDLGSPSNSANMFEPKFKSIITYFFGNRFEIENITRYFFYFKDNKIVLYFRVRNPKGSHTDKYLCIVSFQEILNRDNIIDIFSELIKPTFPTITENKRKKIRIATYNGRWNSVDCDSRSYDTIYLPVATKELVTSEMDKFLCFEKIYKQIGVPYKKGFLLYGPPGTGKTSLVKALAYVYDLPIYIIDVNSELVNDESIVSILNSISGSGNRIVLFEDIDSAFADKEELKYQVRSKSDVIISNSAHESDTSDDEDEPPSLTESKTNNAVKDSPRKFLTYSGLLNALDGVLTSQHGTIVIMTTNYKEKLGDALIRPGRIDFSLELTYCDHHQIVQMTQNMIIKSYEIIGEMLSDKKDENSKCLSKFVFNNPYTTSGLIHEINKFADNLTQGKITSRVKPCELQVYILKYLDNVDNILNNYKELLTC
ncbi:AAA family ATPase [Tupanvirus soda lake]|uniref:AAA family ATPase n=2 Tax=Tupanvirus TaxID=2094720 RepID=A0A6N1NWX1_9VIRU|nr:AAA family ATPase [Tupanvirus soda lake]QKU35806.1 AAA family ATPase [Tupanvirus soda lake]